MLCYTHPMLKIAVCDDNGETAAFLQRSLAAILSGMGIAHDIAVFHAASSLYGALKGGKDEFYGVLKDTYARQLENLDFLYIHAAYAVNFDYVQEMKYDSLHLSGIDFPLPITQDRRKEVRDKYTGIRQRRAGG